MPSCPSEICPGEYLYGSFSSLPCMYRDMYMSLCEKNIDKPKQTLEQKKLSTELVRNKSNKYATALLPAISKTMKLTGLDKRLEKTLAKNLLKTGTVAPINKCISFSCLGSMIIKENVEQCNKCGISMCITCQAIAKQDHKCKEDDIESLEYMKRTVKCPKCTRPAEKSSGCNFLTCPFSLFRW
jgi:hypothetical protein